MGCLRRKIKECYRCGSKLKGTVDSLYIYEKTEGGKSEEIPFCSIQCLEEWLTPYMTEFKRAIKDKTFIPYEDDPNEWFIRKMGLDQKYDPRKWEIYATLARGEYEVDRGIVEQNFYEHLLGIRPAWAEEILARARDLERAGRYEDTAQEYEYAAKQLDDETLLDKARECRARTRKVKVVSVNINALLEQLKRGGIVTVYKCPICGGNLKIDGKTDPKSLKSCSYCGSKIQTVDLEVFLKSILS